MFGKRAARIFARLGLSDAEDDRYALRKTFSSRLYSAGVSDWLRKAILGHRQEGVVNRHYTQQKLRLLKDTMDAVDYGIRVAFDERRGHPVITGCDLAALEAVDVELKLDD